MGELFVYILKSSLCLALFYLFYRLLLSKDTFHRFNRIALLGLIVLSVLVPFIEVVTEKPAIIQQPVQNIESLLLLAQQDAEVSVEQTYWLQGICLVYLAGCLFFILQFMYSAVCIGRLIRNGERRELPGGVRLIITSRSISPFSWMNYIVISRKDMEESENEILTHEMAHIHARHSLDMLIAGICIIFHWFNPAVWLLKLELQNIHEYEADESVLNKGVDARKYQLLLIKKAVGSQRFTSMANSFNHSKLKKRITMMLKQKSNPWARLKYLYVLPLTAVAVTAFARPEISSELEKISSVKVIESLPVTQANGQEKKNVSLIDTTTIVVKKSKNKAAETKADNSTGSSNTTTFVADVIKIKNSDNSETIAKTAIYTASSNNDSVIVVGYGNQKDGAVVISRGDREEATKVVKQMPFSILSTNKDSIFTEGSLITVRDVEGKPLIIVDGEELTGVDISTIDPETIESVSVLKDHAAEELYKEKGKNGVIQIVTKKK